MSAARAAVRTCGFVAGLVLLLLPGAHAQILDKQRLLEAQTFWDNRDWDWYRENIPFLDTPDPDINATYYYRWELVTKHLTYGSPNSGYSFTEFIDRPFWSGAYGAISCPSGHQLYEVRWLQNRRYAQDYARYWFRTPGAQPRNYSCWLADSVWAVHLVHPDRNFTTGLLPDLEANYSGWERSHFVPSEGLFWQTGHDDGMEFNINSRQTRDILRGAPGFRPTLNSYLWADAQAIARIARLAGREAEAAAYEARASGIKSNLQSKLWDPARHFFFEKYRDDEERDGHRIRAGTLTYQSGQYAGDPHGRELHGYVPWQFGLPDSGYESAWQFLMRPDGFYADYGPLTTERNDPLFKVTRTCCWWSGQSWPYATTQTLLAMANLLNQYTQGVVSREDYFRLLQIYTRTQRKAGRPYVAEGANPDTGSWEGYDSPNHSEHYFHSGYVDLVITGLIGLRPRADDTLEVNPLAPEGWDFFALEDVPYRHHRLAIVWDRTGDRYHHGAGLRLWVDGRCVRTNATLGRTLVSVAPGAEAPSRERVLLNFAVNNDGDYFPRISASHSNPSTPIAVLNDGNVWYHRDPPNRWTLEGSTNAEDWCVIDFGVSRSFQQLKLYFLDDGEGVAPPASFDAEFWSGNGWAPVTNQVRRPVLPTGRRANEVVFPPVSAERLRITFHHSSRGRTGLTELEALGAGELPYRPAPPPPGNLALNRTGRGFPRATASFTSPYGDHPMMALDGRMVFRPSPHNRWTSYGSTNRTDWLEVDLGTPREVGRAVLHLYDDHGGVQAPASYTVEYWRGAEWQEVVNPVRTPAVPVGGEANSITFDQVSASKVRVVFTHRGNARSGVTELELWRE